MSYLQDLYHYINIIPMDMTVGCVCVCDFVCGAYGKTLCRSAVSHTPASQIELALTAHSASRVYLCVHWGHQLLVSCPSVCVCTCVHVRVCETEKKEGLPSLKSIKGVQVCKCGGEGGETSCRGQPRQTAPSGAAGGSTLG